MTSPYETLSSSDDFDEPGAEGFVADEQRQTYRESPEVRIEGLREKIRIAEKEGNETEVVRLEHELRTVEQEEASLANNRIQEVTKEKPVTNSIERQRVELQNEIDQLRAKIIASAEEKKRIADAKIIQETEAYDEDKLRGETLRQHEDIVMEKRVNYEQDRASVFNRISPLEKAVHSLTHTISLGTEEVEYLQKRLTGLPSDASEYERNNILEQIREQEEKNQENKTLLERRQEALHAITTFENKLWGDTPEDMHRMGALLWADIENSESRKDLLHVFDIWGALPGVDAVSKPITDKRALEEFFETMESDDVSQVEEKALHMFENPFLRKVVLDLLNREKEQEKNSTAVVEKKHDEKNVSRFSREVTNHDEEQELIDLVQEESDLVRAKKVMNSKMFRFAPILMKLTKEGRDNLDLLKRTGLDSHAVGSGNKNTEIAQAFRLKTVREKRAAMQGYVDRRFADNLQKRQWSQDNVMYEASHPLTEKSGRVFQELQKDKERMASGDTRQINVQRIKDSLNRQRENDSFFQKILGSFFRTRKKEVPRNVATFDDIITPDRITYESTNDQEVVPSAPVFSALRNPMNDVLAEAISSKPEAVYTEVPKKERVKKGNTLKTSGKPKKRSPKKRLL